MARSVMSRTVSAANPFSTVSSMKACWSSLRVRRTRKSSIVSDFCVTLSSCVAYTTFSVPLLVDASFYLLLGCFCNSTLNKQRYDAQALRNSLEGEDRRESMNGTEGRKSFFAG